MAEISNDPSTDAGAQNDGRAPEPPGLAAFKEKINALFTEVCSGTGEYTFPKGNFEGVNGLPWPGQYDFLFTYTPSDATQAESNSGAKTVEIHFFPTANPRAMFDEVKEAALKPDTWGEVSGWVDSPKGFPNPNEYDDVTVSGQEQKNPRYVRWVQQSEGAKGGYFVRLESSAEASPEYLKEYGDALWWVINQVGYYNPNSET